MTAFERGYQDPDEGFDTWDRTRRSLHRNVDTICAAWPQALADVEAIGFSSGRTFDGTSRGGNELTAVEAAAENLLRRHSPAVAFVAEVGDVVTDLTRESVHPSRRPWNARNAQQPMHDGIDELMTELPVGRRWPEGPHGMVRRVERLASAGAHWWPTTPPRTGDVIGGVTVGERGNQAQICALCELPVVSGRDPNGQPLLQQDADGTPFHSDCWYIRKLTPLRAGRRTQCSIDECTRTVHARGWCHSHYNRWRTTGIIGGQVGVA